VNNNGKTLYTLATGMVLDRSALAKCNAFETDIVMASIRCNAGLPLKVVERASKFFTAENLISFIEAKNPEYKLIAEQTGTVVTDDQVTAMQLAAKTRASIKAKLPKAA
jgi:hypothetical protein